MISEPVAFQNQREVIRVNPDDAELRVVGIVSGHVLQDLQELVAICAQQVKCVQVKMLRTIKGGEKLKLIRKRDRPGSSSSANATM